LLHGLCALLLAAIVRRTLRGPRLAELRGERRSTRLAAALLFLAPARERGRELRERANESLVALFYLATPTLDRARTSERPWASWRSGRMLGGRHGDEGGDGDRAARSHHDAVFLGRDARGSARVRAVLWPGLAATRGVLGALVLQQPRSESAGFALWVTPAVYLANQCLVVTRYLRLVFWPSPLRLDYGLPEPLAFGDVWLAAALLLALLALSLYALWRWPASGFVGIACFAILAPSSSVIPIVSEVGAERRMVLPLAALLALVVCLAWRGLERAGRTRPHRGSQAWSRACSRPSVQRAGVHADEVALWRADVVAAPMNARARYTRGRSGARVERRTPRPARGGSAGRDRILCAHPPLQPDRVQALGDLATLYFVAGDLARADQLYGEVLELAPGDPILSERRALVRERLAAQEGAATQGP
jgi:hypothetical protein